MSHEFPDDPVIKYKFIVVYRSEFTLFYNIPGERLCNFLWSDINITLDKTKWPLYNLAIIKSMS